MKTLKDYFPTIVENEAIPSKLHNLLVERAVQVKNNNTIILYILSDCYIKLSDIRILEKELIRYIIRDPSAKLKINQRIEISELYTSQDIFDNFKKIFEDEIRRLGELAKALLSPSFSMIEFEDERMIIHFTDSVRDYNPENDIIPCITNVYKKYFRRDVEVIPVYDYERFAPYSTKVEYGENDANIAVNEPEKTLQCDKSYVTNSTIVNSDNIDNNVIINEKTSMISDEIANENNTATHLTSFITEEEYDDDDDEYDQYERELLEESGAFDEEDVDADGFSKNEKEVVPIDLETMKAEFEKVGKKNKKQNKDENKDPSLVLGKKDIAMAVTHIKDINDQENNYCINVELLAYEEKKTKASNMIKLTVTDYTDSIIVKFFVKDVAIDSIRDALSKGGEAKKNIFLKIIGIPLMDSYERYQILFEQLQEIKLIPSFKKKRIDDAPEKRVELHVHTKMSANDAVTDVKKLVQTAFFMGHKAVAITDHGVVQGFPDARPTFDHAFKKVEMSDEDKERLKSFKVIYGMEAYLVDDLVKCVLGNTAGEIPINYVIISIAATGNNFRTEKLIAINAMKIENGEVKDCYETFVNPEKPIPGKVTLKTGIKDKDVINKKVEGLCLAELKEFIDGSVVVAYDGAFVFDFLNEVAKRNNTTIDLTVIDLHSISQALADKECHSIISCCNEFGLLIGREEESYLHYINKLTLKIWKSIMDTISSRKITTLSELNEKITFSVEKIKKSKYYHCIILCQNETGRVNLYQLVSLSHCEYFQRRPRIPKSELIKHREGLILGSACEAGELYRALLSDANEGRIAELCNFYDYLELQPVCNNMFMINKLEKPYDKINSQEDIIDINLQIIELGKKFNKLVVGTTDSHFLNKEDGIFRKILQDSQNFKREDVDSQPDLYFRTTNEMLEEFSYLDDVTAKEIVIDNPGKIADMIEVISPINPKKAPPVIPNSDETLKKICYTKAYEMYGDPLPKEVEDRLERELGPIIRNGYAVMYIIAQKLVWKSNEDGYLVGSRGSVGSSFVATMAGITEVNPLPPHYYCEHCHYTDFGESEVVREFAKAGKSGCDMPNKICPKCGQMLKKDGHNIPFETFLGFKGDKEPDIDLNFSGEYQSKAHEYTEVIFGYHQTFKAGTLGTVAEKTAYSYTKKYFEKREEIKRYCEIERISQGCIDVGRTTGQHPGGIVVLPINDDINNYTPIQHPANKMDNPRTTHFDYHKIDGNLLKLDILGHQDPTMIRKLQVLTGVDPLTIPLDDEKVISLLTSTEALGIKPEDIDGCNVGSLGLPELGTNFVIGMLESTKPNSFSEVVRISGLSHGTDVWNGNAEYLIKSNICTLSNAICTRDDIMIYLISMGLDNEFSFKIMESVRKGRGLTPQMEEDMIAHNVPDWYINSCKMIKYMFPKAHAVAYVTMAFRVAFFKVYYPIAYYSAYFSIRAQNTINYESMCVGKEVLLENIAIKKKEISEKKAAKKTHKTDDDMLVVMHIVLEFYARGFKFEKIKLGQAKAHDFIVIDDKTLMPALDSIGSLGANMAEILEDGSRDTTFSSVLDFKTKNKGVSDTITEKLINLKILEGLPKSNQLSFEDILNGAS